MKSSLNHKKDFLCVLAEYSASNGPHTAVLVREWYPVYRADETEIRTLLGRLVTQVDSDEGIYIDEEGTVFRLLEGGRTEPIEVERSSGKQEEAPSTGAETPPDARILSAEGAASEKRCGKNRTCRRSKAIRNSRAAHGNLASDPGMHATGDGLQGPETPAPETVAFAELNLRQKLALVRRRISYVQKRGHNQLLNYSYVTAADIAGAVGDILAEIGVVVVPRLESIAYEAVTGRMGAERSACVVMSYSFVDVDTGEEITVKVAGEGLDPGDKAAYKAMTGALKYALLQSFLLATGDDPEDERPDSRTAFGSERLITAEQARQLQGLIEETGTDLERVLAYYKVSALSEMTEASHRRALELLYRKLDKQSQGGGARAQN
jgi:ERF superfamily